MTVSFLLVLFSTLISTYGHPATVRGHTPHHLLRGKLGTAGQGTTNLQGIVNLMMSDRRNSAQNSPTAQGRLGSFPGTTLGNRYAGIIGPFRKSYTPDSGIGNGPLGVALASGGMQGGKTSTTAATSHKKRNIMSSFLPLMLRGGLNNEAFKMMMVMSMMSNMGPGKGGNAMVMMPFLMQLIGGGEHLGPLKMMMMIMMMQNGASHQMLPLMMAMSGGEMKMNSMLPMLLTGSTSHGHASSWGLNSGKSYIPGPFLPHLLSKLSPGAA